MTLIDLIVTLARQRPRTHYSIGAVLINDGIITYSVYKDHTTPMCSIHIEPDGTIRTFRASASATFHDIAQIADITGIDPAR